MKSGRPCKRSQHILVSDIRSGCCFVILGPRLGDWANFSHSKENKFADY